MLSKVKVDKLIEYWHKTAEHDYETMVGLYRIRRYSDSLFFGHIILEKILKGLVVKETKRRAPYIHNLIELTQIGNLDLNKKEKVLLVEVNEFNISCRYPEEKLRFYKQVDKKYTKYYLDQIKKLYNKLCERLIKNKLKK